MAKLDLKKPHGEIHGDDVRKYEQDGKYFDGQGNELDAAGKVVKEAKAEKAAEKPADNAVDAQLAKQ